MVTEPNRWVDEAANLTREEVEFLAGASTIGELIGFDPIGRKIRRSNDDNATTVHYRSPSQGAT